MNALAVAVLALGVSGARIETVRLVDVGGRLGVQLRLTSAPARVAVHREGNLAGVSFDDTVLGGLFSGSENFEWVPASAGSSLPPAWAPLEALRIQRNRGGVNFYFRVPAEMAIEVRSQPSVVTLVLHEPRPPSAPTLVASAPPPPTPPPPAGAARPVAAPPGGAPPVEAPQMPAPGTVPSPSASMPRAATPPPSTVIAPTQGHVPRIEAPSPSEGRPEPVVSPTQTEARPLTAETAELLRTLFPPAVPSPTPTQGTPPGGGAAETGTGERPVASVDELYRKLFPFAPPETQKAAEIEPQTKAAGPRTLTLGFLTLHPSLHMSYLNGETTLESVQPTKASYFQVQPGLGLETTFWDGRLNVGYEPYLRSFSSLAVVNETTQRVVARLDLPVGTRFHFKASESFVSGVLETQEVDPGYEYFFHLSRFHRNVVAVNGSLDVAPRLSIEAGGAFNTVRFNQPAGFFSYDSRSASLGLGYELAPKLKATLGYVYDRVPPPAERPLAEATAHSVQATFSGELTPLLLAQLVLGYRDQDNPLAPQSGRRFRGLTGSGSVTRAFGTASSLTLLVSRDTLPSDFASNAFYVSAYADASLVLPLPLSFSLESGIGHRWNDYRTDALELGRPRNDRIFGWRVGLRRPFWPGTTLGIGYRRDRRQSNLAQFDTTADGLVFQLDVDIFAAAPGFR